MATDPAIIGAGIAGMIIALVWRGVLPYLLKRQEAEQNGQTPPPFSSTYITTFLVSIVGGMVSIMLIGDEFDMQLESARSVFSAMAIGGTFTFTVLSGLNSLVDLKSSKIALASKLDPAVAKEAELNKSSSNPTT